MTNLKVHAVTKLALSDFEFQNKRLEFISAYSGAEAKTLIDEHKDAAIVFLMLYGNRRCRPASCKIYS